MDNTMNISSGKACLAVIGIDSTGAPGKLPNYTQHNWGKSIITPILFCSGFKYDLKSNAHDNQFITISYTKIAKIAAIGRVFTAKNSPK